MTTMGEDYRVCLFGSRDLKSVMVIATVIEGLKSAYGDDLVVVTGGAPGADTLAHGCARIRNVRTEVIEADWNPRLGKAAGPIRNQAVVDSKLHEAWGFVNKPIEQSKGSNDMKQRLALAEIPFTICQVRQPHLTLWGSPT